MRHLLITNTLIAVIYVGLFAIQDIGFRQGSQLASLVFLPHGWRVISFFIFRFKGIPGLFVGHVATCMLFFDNFQDIWAVYIATCVVSTLALPAGYLVLKAIGFDLLSTRPEYPVVPFYKLLGMGVVATLLNGLLVQSVYALGLSSEMRWDLVQLYLMGDLAGMTMFIVGLMLFFRWQRQKHRMVTQSSLQTPDAD